MEKIKNNKRKILQILRNQWDEYSSIITILCDDNSIWTLYNPENIEDSYWTRLKDIPQD